MIASFDAIWVTSIAAIGMCFISYLAIRSEGVRLGYAIHQVQAERRCVSATNRRLTIERQALRDPDRLRLSFSGVDLTLDWRAPEHAAAPWLVVGAP